MRRNTDDEMAMRSLAKLQLPEIRGAKEIAVLVKNIRNLDECAALIEQYALLVASGATLDATLERVTQEKGHV